jgi:hypothetical protein
MTSRFSRIDYDKPCSSTSTLISFSTKCPFLASDIAVAPCSPAQSLVRGICTPLNKLALVVPLVGAVALSFSTLVINGLVGVARSWPYSPAVQRTTPLVQPYETRS